MTAPHRACSGRGYRNPCKASPLKVVEQNKQRLKSTVDDRAWTEEPRCESVVLSHDGCTPLIRKKPNHPHCKAAAQWLCATDGVHKKTTKPRSRASEIHQGRLVMHLKTTRTNVSVEIETFRPPSPSPHYSAQQITIQAQTRRSDRRSHASHFVVCEKRCTWLRRYYSALYMARASRPLPPPPELTNICGQLLHIV